MSVIALVATVTLSVTLLLEPAPTLAAGHVSTTTEPCQSSRFNSDYLIDQCLETNIRTMSARMESALRRESGYLRYVSRSEDWRVAKRTQATFVTFAREECLAQAHPYQPGTIVPILYGECVLQLYHQRLDYLDRTIAWFKNGGESQASP